MAKGVPEIQVRAHPALALIFCHDSGFDGAAALNGVRHNTGVTILERCNVLYEPAEKFRIANQAVLHYLSQPSRKLALRQRGKGIEVNQHLLGLMESPDQVFTQLVVDPGFAPDRRVHLCQQRCRHLNKICAAQKAGRSKARHISDHSSAQGDKEAVPFVTVSERRIENFLHRVEVLACFTSG